MEEREIIELTGEAVEDSVQAEAYTVSQVNQGIAAALKQSFPGSFWVTGELQQYARDAAAAKSRAYGQVYFELVEKEDGKDQIKSKIKALMWGRAHEKILARLREIDPKLTLQDGLEVRLLCRVDYYWKGGNLQLQVEDIDPSFTLGRMERARRELIKKLKAAGLYDKNRQTTLPCPALRLGLITAEGSAAYHDFTDELKKSGYAFELFFWRSSMQGEGTEDGIIRGIERLCGEQEVEAIVIVRGGGSRSDLIWFDKEAIAMAIANCPKPVLTGIGHEIDQSVADLVAYRSFKTPTAIAQFFVEGCRSCETQAAAAAREICSQARRMLSEHEHSLASSGRSLLSETRRHLSLSRERLLFSFSAIRGASAHALKNRARDLALIPGSMNRSVSMFFERGFHQLDALAKECRLRDPARLLKQGYSLAYDEAGKLVKSAKALKPGSALDLRFADGTAAAEVRKVRSE